MTGSSNQNNNTSTVQRIINLLMSCSSAMDSSCILYKLDGALAVVCVCRVCRNMSIYTEIFTIDWLTEQLVSLIGTHLVYIHVCLYGRWLAQHVSCHLKEDLHDSMTLMIMVT